MRFTVASLVAFVGVASAASGCSQVPNGGNPSGNPIALPGLGQVVPAGTPFTITWNPTTAGTVSIVLLRGPSTNVLPIGCIVENLPNSGKFVWTPSTTLTPDVTHYGLQIIVTGTGEYQYSTQFGISNPVGSTVSQISDGQIQAPGSTSAPSSSSKTSASSSASASSLAASFSATASSSSISVSSTSVIATTKLSVSAILPSIAPINSVNATKPIITSVPAPTFPVPTSTSIIVSTGFAPNSSIVQPTVSMTVPATLQTSALATSTSPSATSKSAAAAATGAAVKSMAGGMLAGLGMIAALVL